MISVVIPAYNEENRIEHTIKSIEAALLSENLEFEILVVNDGSTDATARVVSALENGHVRLYSYTENRGKGGAVTFGVKQARGDMVIFTDADLPYPPENIKKACAMLESGYDVVLGSRTQNRNGQTYPWYRTVMSEAFGLLVNLVLHLKEKDTQCGFKAFKIKAARQIFQRVSLNGWGFDVEIIFIAQKLGLTIGRLSVELFHTNQDSKIHMVKDTVNMAREVFQVKKNDKKGLYQ